MVSNLTGTRSPGSRARRNEEQEGGSAVTLDEEGLLEAIAKLTVMDKEGGDGGDSDEDGEELEFHGEDMFKKGEETDSSVEQAVIPEKEGEVKGLLKITSAGTTEFIGEMGLDGSHNLESINGNINIPKPPTDFVPPSPRSDEPLFENVDNPGNWDRFYFQPKQNKSKKYAGHFLPTGARPVPLGPDGTRKQGDWNFYYNGYRTNDDSKYRRGASTSNLFPAEMKGHLDVDIMKRLGCNEDRVKKADALFFFQLLLPFCDTSKSGVRDDPRMNYYTEVSKFTNVYAYLNGQGSDYGHVWKNTSAMELVRFDGVLFHDGSLGGSNGAIYRRWDPRNDNYSEKIRNAMTITRYGELKRNLKLCNNDACPKRGEPEYDPSYKYDLVYKCIVNNTNAISRKADETQVIDETTWGHSGYGESGTGVTGRLRNKKVSKGGQTVLMMDRHRFRIRAYLHRNKIYDEVYSDKKTREWSANGPYELKHLSDQLMKMCDGNPSSTKKLFREKPCITGDNYFQNDKVMHYLGTLGFGAILTSSRNSLPKEIKSEFLHKEKTDPKNKAAKVARFAQPIVAVKKTDSYERVHVSFQSTSSCNISTVNALNEVYNFVELRERGRGANKRHWVIEMNHARRIYLTSYNGIDVLDHLIKNARLFYQTWKYWHAPKNHGLAIAIAVAYDIYKECCEGGLCESWKCEPIESWQFQNILSNQALTYSPTKHLYPGDQALRVSTVIPKQKRPCAQQDRSTGRITRTTLQALTEGDRSRGCGDLDKICTHLNSVGQVPKGRACAWCGKKAYHVCSICNVGLHIRTKSSIIDQCFFHWHNDNRIGLARDDAVSLRKRRRSDWEEPNRSESEENREHIQELKMRFR